MGVLFDLLAAPFVVRKLQQARILLETVTPLKTDCGRLCDGACCKADETGENGMLLFPFEERFYQKPVEGFAFRLTEDDGIHKNGKRLICEGHCPREHRPLACRIFPLRIRVLSEQGGNVNRAVAELDPRAWAVCPLLEEGGLRAMSRDFIKAVEEVGALFCKNVYLLEALLNEQKFIDDSRRL
ncbi:MAG TPA: hypothetical protein PLP25_04545 [Candidatus Limiplasma sp.]|nr:hypothetical protein [Candidatus Limiplasma sp.]HPS81112.1 hypothetical protein [Candidatus Limiplasma sp.]